MNRVLCVDDSATVRRFIVKAMEQFRFRQIHEAGNGREALECLKQNDVDLIILDMKMPVMNGVEFMEACAGIDRYRSIPVIVLSTEGKNEDLVERAIALGAKAFLQKPFELREMKKAIARISATEDSQPEIL